MLRWLIMVSIVAAAAPASRSEVPTLSTPASRPATQPAGYRGVWYNNQPRDDERESTFSGGMATYSTQNVPIAIYAEKVKKTFFVYGGVSPGRGPRPGNRLQIMAGCYDHATGHVQRPTLVTSRTPADAHENPALAIDGEGHIWVFAPARNPTNKALIFKSTKPHDISAFEQAGESAFVYPQPWFMEGQGFMLLHSYYQGGPQIAFTTSKDGREWTDRRPLANMGSGHYQVSGRFKNKIGTAFNFHVKGNLNAGTNLYYVESADFGQTWTTASKENLDLPLTSPESEALVFDYQSANQVIYVRDLNFDAAGNPTILYMTSRGYQSGPSSGLRIWATARWTLRGWEISSLVRSDDNYDSGCLHIEPRNVWRLIAPTDAGPEPGAAGGEIVMWISDDLGRAWQRQNLTRESPLNHNWVRRPVDAQPDFYLLWADGAVRRPSESRLYFATQEGRVYRLPTEMPEASAKPIEMPNLVPPPATEPAASESSPANPE